MNSALFDPSLLTRRQLAERLNTTYARVLGFEREGIPHIQLEGVRGKNKAVRFDFVEVLKWLRARETQNKNGRVSCSERSL